MSIYEETSSALMFPPRNFPATSPHQALGYKSPLVIDMFGVDPISLSPTVKSHCSGPYTCPECPE